MGPDPHSGLHRGLHHAARHFVRLTPDEKWHARFNAQLQPNVTPTPSGWGAVIGVVLALMIGATVLMATIAFSGQRYFEYQVQEGLKLSQ